MLNVFFVKNVGNDLALSLVKGEGFHISKLARLHVIF